MDDSQPNLIFMVGLTGSGKSHLKTILFKEFNINNKPPVSVDDIFEKDEESISIFHKLYTFHFGKDCEDDSKLSENIRITRYLSRLLGMGQYSITIDCVLNQIHKRYCPDKNTIPFSQFASAVYFALREKRLDHLYDEKINESVGNNKNIIIETNGENVNGIITWYMGGEEQSLEHCPQYNKDLKCKSKNPAINLKQQLSKYNKTVCFLKRDICPTLKSIKDRILGNICTFIEKKRGPVPRIPEIDRSSFTKKIDGINTTYTKFKENPGNYGFNNVRVYENNGNAISDVTLPDMLYKPTTEKTCDKGGRRTKRRRKPKCRKSKLRRRTKSRLKK